MLNKYPSALAAK
ncbi:hypothetical protein PEB0149_012580 [Bartonella apis]|uniref:Uncharacterized protein n=1 Tax=Bartonella apis TaxID=1686310 RepID=A0A1R0FA03_9HYPH|nr:hypothetical protein PEB0149_012580 [Bartonella apis]